MGTLEIKDYEIEFLKLMNIEYVDGELRDLDTNDVYRYCGYRHYLSTTGNQELFTYECGAKRIEFHRIINGLYPFMATVSVNYGGYKHWARQDFFDGVIRERTVGISDDNGDFIDRRNPNYSSCIMFKQTDSSDYISETNLSEGFGLWNYKSYDITSSLSTIYSGAKHVHEYGPYEMDDVVYSKEEKDVSPENYEDLLKEAIESNFADKEEFKNFYLKIVPYFKKAFVSSLTVPFRYKSYYAKRLEKRQTMIEENYASNKEAKMQELAKMQEFLDTYYPGLEINQKNMTLQLEEK